MWLARGRVCESLRCPMKKDPRVKPEDDFVGGVGFLVLSVGLCLGQSLRSRTRVPITSLTTPAHPEPCGDAAHQLCDHAQQRRQRKLTKRRACKAMCVCSRRCHGAENTLGGGTRGKLGMQIFCVSHKSRGQSLEIVGEDFSVSDSGRDRATPSVSRARARDPPPPVALQLREERGGGLVDQISPSASRYVSRMASASSRSWRSILRRRITVRRALVS